MRADDCWAALPWRDIAEHGLGRRTYGLQAFSELFGLGEWRNQLDDHGCGLHVVGDEHALVEPGCPNLFFEFLQIVRLGANGLGHGLPWSPGSWAVSQTVDRLDAQVGQLL